MAGGEWTAGRSAYNGTRRQVFVGYYDGDMIGVLGREEHSLALDAAKGSGLEVGDDYDLLAEEFFGGDMLLEAGNELALFASGIHLEHVELIGVGMVGHFLDFGYAKLKLLKIFE